MVKNSQLGVFMNKNLGLEANQKCHTFYKKFTL